MQEERDIVLVLGSGGMMGVFTAGVMEVIDKRLRNRVHSVYATSSGADVGVYFVSNQAQIPRRFFIEYLASDTFLRKNWVAYMFKIFFTPQSDRIPDFIDLDLVVRTARESDCSLDTQALTASDISFFVKVIDVSQGRTHYLPAKENVFEKLRATSQCGPFTSTAVELDGKQYIDGDTIFSNIDAELAHRFSDKKIIYIEPAGGFYTQKILLYPFYILAGLAIARLYGWRLGARYIHELFYDSSKYLCKFGNIVCIRNDRYVSSFCTNKKELNDAFDYGVKLAEKTLQSV